MNKLQKDMKAFFQDKMQDSYNNGYKNAIKDITKGFEGNPSDLLPRNGIISALEGLLNEVNLVMEVKEEATK